MKKISKLWIAVGIIVLIALITWLLSGNKKKEEVTFETVAAAPATISNSITATGTIEPVTNQQQHYCHRYNRACYRSYSRYTGQWYRQQTLCRLQQYCKKGTGYSRARQDQSYQPAKHRKS